MDLGLLKWLKETRFYERIKKKYYTDMLSVRREGLC